jgi:hypothetical protein
MSETWYLERYPDEGCPAGCDECEHFERGYLALRYREADGTSFEVAKVNGGGIAEEKLRDLLELALKGPEKERGSE